MTWREWQPHTVEQMLTNFEQPNNRQTFLQVSPRSWNFADTVVVVLTIVMTLGQYLCIAAYANTRSQSTLPVGNATTLSSRQSVLQTARSVQRGYKVPASWHTDSMRQQQWWPQEFRRRQEQLAIRNWQHHQEAIAHFKALKDPRSPESVAHRLAMLRIQKMLQTPSRSTQPQATVSLTPSQKYAGIQVITPAGH
jgi:hypothetical protein